MSNLGSDTTPVKGQNFELPAGAQLDEDNGDLVIRDSGGSIVFRRDETNGEWALDDLSADSVNTVDADITDKLQDAYQASEILSGYKSIHSALDAANNDGGGTVHIVGAGSHSIAEYSKSLTDVDIVATGPVSLTTSDSYVFDLPDVTDVTFEGLTFNAPLRVDTPTTRLDFKRCYFDNNTTMQWGRGGGEIVDSGLHDCRVSLWNRLNAKTRSFKMTDIRHESPSGHYLLEAIADFKHRGLILNNVNFGGNSLGVDLSDCSLDYCNINVTSDESSTRSVVKAESYDGKIEAMMQNGYVHLLGGRDTDVTVDIEDATGVSGVIVEKIEDNFGSGNDGASHAIRGHISGMDNAGVRLKGGTECNIDVTAKQNSRASTGTWSGVQFDEVTINGNTYGSKYNIISGGRYYDRLSTMNQKYGIEDVGSSDDNYVAAAYVGPNATGNLSLNTNSEQGSVKTPNTTP